MSLATELDVVNAALYEVGANGIMSFNEGSVEANVAKVQYPLSRDEVLAASWWIFARKFKELAPLLSVGDLFGYSNAFGLPDDFIRMIQTEDDDRFILFNTGNQVALATDLSAIKVAYVARIVDTTKWDDLFTSTIILLLSSKFALSVVHSKSLAESKFTLYKDKILDAVAANGGGENSPRTLGDRGILSAMKHRSGRRNDKVRFNG